MGCKAETEMSRAAIEAIRIAFPRALPIRVHSGQLRVARGYMRAAPEGTPDWLIVLPDHGSCWMEFKMPGGKFKPGQEPMHAQLRALGQLVYVVHSPSEAVECVRDAITRSGRKAA